MQTSLISIQGELEAARERLKGVEENIKKSIGRDVIGNQRIGFKRTNRQLEGGDGTNDDLHSQRQVQFKRRSIINAPDPNARRRDIKGEERVPAKKRLGEQTVTVFSRLSGPPRDEDIEKETPKSKVSSQVIVQDTPSRKDILAAQSGDKQCKARNRRMFGALLGTLQKFRQEEDALKEKEEKRAQVEKKLEEAALREKEEIKKKRQELFSTRRQQQMEIRQLEYKLMRLKQLEEWESTKKHLLNFIQTSASPKIFYLPKRHCEKSEKLLEQSRQKVTKTIEAKRAEVEKAIASFAAAADKPQPEGPKEAEEEENGLVVEERPDVEMAETAEEGVDCDEVPPPEEDEEEEEGAKEDLNGSVSDKENLNETIAEDDEKGETV
ncbi:pinin [Cimex lectularius]|uniref:Pinin/SDK/MemA protein domain-containing protein n=1 Tax=Cimex lectularius TaxID=79782 RepID=A0A8I6RZW2_CIMLE|nr:pinin [Cimex lectularius]